MKYKIFRQTTNPGRGREFTKGLRLIVFSSDKPVFARSYFNVDDFLHDLRGCKTYFCLADLKDNEIEQWHYSSGKVNEYYFERWEHICADGNDIIVTTDGRVLVVSEEIQSMIEFAKMCKVVAEIIIKKDPCITMYADTDEGLSNAVDAVACCMADFFDTGVTARQMFKEIAWEAITGCNN